MESGAESGVAAARWPWARGGDYGQESSLPAAAGLGLLGSTHPSLSRGDPRISGFWLENVPAVEETPARSCCLLLGSCQWRGGVTGRAPSPCSQADACLCPGLVFGGAGIPGICKELGSGWGRAGRLLQHEPSGLFSLCARQCLGRRN